MILKGSEIEVKNGRKPYELGGRKISVQHFVTRVTIPENPFKPHQHEKPELWYIVGGEGMVELEGTEQPVIGGDLIVIDSWVSHGLRTETQVTWICLG
ncbi:MAG: cupin domain-containing protein [Anaerolineae bacterium]|nr:cupin domain-containing protein [Anaerolineae bacterium]